jgi:hypothetical protein
MEFEQLNIMEHINYSTNASKYLIFRFLYNHVFVGFELMDFLEKDNDLRFVNF